MSSFFISLAFVVLPCLVKPPQSQAKPYDFRASPQYRVLSKEDHEKLEQVHKDFATLSGALEMFADNHGDQSPEHLEALVPLYLRELPQDPFSTAATRAQTDVGSYVPCLDGRGYRYQAGHGRAWIIASVGLKGFPYLASEGNVDLYRPKGYWSQFQFIMSKSEAKKQDGIEVEVRGKLANVTLATGADDDSPRVSRVTVRSGGNELPLDCSKCVAAHRMLIQRYGNPIRSSAIDYPEVLVKGRLEFRSVKGEVQDKDVSSPIIVVESLSLTSQLTQGW